MSSMSEEKGQEEIVVQEVVKRLRLEQNLSIIDLAQATRITIEFIRGLEEGNYQSFPALAYSAGLLANLLEFLKVDEENSAKIVEQFEKDFLSFKDDNYRLTDIGNLTRQPAKKGEVLSSESSSQALGESESTMKSQRSGKSGEVEEEKKSFFIWFIVILVLGLVIFFILRYRNFQEDMAVSELEQEIEVPRSEESYSLYNSSGTFTLGVGDEVKVFFHNKIVKFYVEGVREPGETGPAKLRLQYQIGQANQYVILDLYQDVEISLDKDEKKDLLVKFQQLSGDLGVVYLSLIDDQFNNIDYAAIWDKQEKKELGDGEHILLKNEAKAPIVGYIKATTLPIHLSYNVDGNRQNVINLKPGNQFSILAQNHLELQIGNYRTAQLVVNRIPLKLINNDENQFSITKIIKWVPSPNNETRFDLIIKNFIN